MKLDVNCRNLWLPEDDFISTNVIKQKLDKENKNQEHLFYVLSGSRAKNLDKKLYRNKM